MGLCLSMLSSGRPLTSRRNAATTYAIMGCPRAGGRLRPLHFQRPQIRSDGEKLYFKLPGECLSQRVGAIPPRLYHPGRILQQGKVGAVADGAFPRMRHASPYRLRTTFPLGGPLGAAVHGPNRSRKFLRQSATTAAANLPAPPARVEFPHPLAAAVLPELKSGRAALPPSPKEPVRSRASANGPRVPPASRPRQR